ncbi:TlpA family protein disulfide reductase [bacterium]|nr:TlpA family protein disulfide reductase [bacterium]
MSLRRAATFFIMSFLLLGCEACGPADLEVQGSDTVDEVNLITWDQCGYQKGDHMCDFTLKDQNGQSFSLYENVGNPIVIDYSTMWCGYCQVAAQEVTEIETKYKESGLIYVTILIEDTSGQPTDEADCASWSSVFGIIDAPVLAGSRDLIDATEESGPAISGWPSFLFLDKELVITSFMRGYSKPGLESGIQTIIAD